MKKTAVALTSAILSLGAVSVAYPAEAQANREKEIRVAGGTPWPETYAVIRELRQKWGIPISSRLCRPQERYCITIRHINSANGQAGLAEGRTGNAVVTLNSYYDRGIGYRKALLYHEMGHALGLWEHSGCDSSMSSRIAQCGHYVLGYNAGEQEKLMREWA